MFADVKAYLAEFGLAEHEADIYLNLLQNGPQTVLELSRNTGINRTTIHVNVEALIGKGIVSQTRIGSRRQAVAEPPERLAELLEEQKWKVKKLENNFPDILGLIHKSIPQVKENTESEIKYYEGKKNVGLIYQDALEAKEFRAYVNCHDLAQVFPDNIANFLETHAQRKDMSVWEIIDDSDEARAYAAQMPKERYYYKFIPKNINLSVVDYMIYDGKVAIVNLEAKTSGLVISNQNYYKNSQAIFDLMWQMLPPSSESS